VDKVKIRSGKKGSGESNEQLPKQCPECQEIVPNNVSVCPDCGYLWQAEERGLSHNAEADDEAPLSTNDPSIESFDVLETGYKVWRKKGADDDAPKTLCVSYKVGYSEWVREWICFEHQGFAWTKAYNWWSARSLMPMPQTSAEAWMLCMVFKLVAVPAAIKTKQKSDSNFPEVIEYELSDKPHCNARCKVCGTYLSVAIVEDEDNAQPKVVCAICNEFYAWAAPEVVDHYGLYDETLATPAAPITFEMPQPKPSLFDAIYSAPEGADPLLDPLDDIPF
jgi:hypothetical protein